VKDALDNLAARWRPAGRTEQKTLHAESFRAFSDLLDADLNLEDGDPVPLLWHWVAVGSSCRQSELGEDGHPTTGHFLPPFENRRRMMAGGSIRQLQPFTIGSRYERLSELVSVEIKAGRTGRMLFTTLRHTFTDDRNQVIAVEEEHVVYRQQEQGQPRGYGARPNDDAAWDSQLDTSRVLEFQPEEKALFRFSALTYNAHRIHYDAPYTTEVEGYPNLVVHGPLLALYLLELPRRAQLRVAEFRYRLTSPAFLGSTLRVAQNAQGTLSVGMAGASAPSAQGLLVATMGIR